MKTCTLALLALAFPIAALADLNGTITLLNDTALSLDTGATSSSGGDILFTGGAATSSITPQGSATAFVAANVGHRFRGQRRQWR